MREADREAGEGLEIIGTKPGRGTKLRNEYEIRGEVTSIFLRQRNGGILETIIDTDDLKKVKILNGSWYAEYNKKTDSYYARIGSRQNGIITRIYMHRLIMDCPDHLMVDHINHNTLDNRSENLRNVDNTVNQQNRYRCNKTNKCGVRGVCWDGRKGRWRVQGSIDGKRRTLGSFQKFEDAVRKAEEFFKNLA